MSAKLLNLLTRVIGSQSYKLGQQGEYMYWSPFISHHKPKLQVNIDTGKWHCWVSNNGGHNLFQLLKKLKVSRKYYQELETLVGKQNITELVRKKQRKLYHYLMSLYHYGMVLNEVLNIEMRCHISNVEV